MDDTRLDETHFDAVVIGSGFGSLFFLEEALKRGIGRVLVLERGPRWDHGTQLLNGANSPIPASETFIANPLPGAEDKYWNFNVGLGGGTNCWFAQTPRPLPSDFEMARRFGHAMDWPFGYDALEPFLLEAEQIMAIAGEEDIAAVSPRSGPFAQPPHRLSAVDRAMKRAAPDQHFALPTARARVATANRPACCASLRCKLCPVNAKFTALGEMRHILQNERVTVVTDARVRRLEETGGTVRAAEVEIGGVSQRVTGDLFVLGANAVHSPAILLASGMGDEHTGRYLHESCGASAEILLDGLDNFDGSTITTGINYALAGDAVRRDRAAVVLFFENRWTYGLRTEPGRARQSAPITLVAEDLPHRDNRVTLGADGEPVVTYGPASPYAKRAIGAAMEALPEVTRALPVEDIVFRGYRRTESHLQGTLRTGTDPATSVVDANLVHHRYRNLVVVGSSVFASCLNANPSLTVAALSLKSATALMGAQS